MTLQHALFHDSILDAIAADVAAIGGVKKAAALLWPAVSDAAGRLRACLSPEHAQKLDPEEVLRIKALARDVGSFATVAYESQALGYRFEWTAPEDEQARLQREFIEMGKRMEQVLAQMNRNGARIQAVK